MNMLWFETESQGTDMTQVEIVRKVDVPSAARGGHVAALDGLRGLAIVLVLLEHFGGGRHSHSPVLHAIGEATRLGWIGVSLFFVLSGFLISGIVWDSIGGPHWWGRFYIRRALRIFPLYYGALVYAVIIGITLQPQLLHGLWAFALYLQNLGTLGSVANSARDHLILDHFWSLAVEEQFYIVWPLILAMMAPRRILAMRVCAGIWIGSCALRLAFAAAHMPETWLYRFTPSRGGELCLGACLALYIRGNPDTVSRTLRRAWPVLIVAATALLILATVTYGSFETSNVLWTTIGIFLLPVFFAALVALCLQPGMMQRVFRAAVLRWLGKISYGIYVYHLLLQPVYHRLAIRLLPDVAPTMQDLCTSIIGVFGTLLIATVSFRFFESPFLRLKRYFPVTPLARQA